MKSSSHLVLGSIYSRKDLQEQFKIVDATIRTGVFRPKGFDSVWLFVTAKKTLDQTQYADFLDGNLLHWDGQTSGRSDPTIIDHRRNGIELLLFYREAKDKYPNFGFRYEGPFEYVSHKGAGPAHFKLKRVGSK